MRRAALALFLAGSGAACSHLIGVDGDVVILAADTGTDALGTASDAGRDAPAEAEAAAPSGSILCKGAPCAVPANICCQGAAGTVCQPSSMLCPGPARACDDTEDCPAPQVCCIIQIFPTTMGTACRNACSAGEPRACTKSAECAPAACVEIACAGARTQTCNGEGVDAGCE